MNNGTSQVEQEFRDVFSKHFTSINVSSSIKTKIQEKWLQLDIVGILYGCQVVIEYDGSYWHNNDEVVEKDKVKTLSLLADGYTVVRIREHHHTKLPFLGISHPRYYELKYVFGEDVEETVNKILFYVKTLTSQN